MGRPPAYIFIVRHGNRLDAADKLWHLSSPTPYDPPLTYGGWTQARAIGQRIAEILRDSEAQITSTAEAGSGPKKRRFKVVIHSSPFLRCIQTSVAVGAGLAADFRPRSSSSSSATSPQAATSDGIRTLLRLDAFLGEWLSPGYFELITPPPSSFMMVASAKADLLRREDYSHFVHAPTYAHGQSTSQLWGGSRSNTWSAQLAGDDELPTSGSRPISPPAIPSSDGGSAQASPRTPSGYVAPVLHFALSSKAAVPTGYVAHARDACIEVDYQWDSMRPPHDWGDGGEYGEEWTTMHRRFRRGLQHLVDWYTTSSSDPTEAVAKAIHFASGGGGANQNSSAECAIDDEEAVADSSDGEDGGDVEEPVVILVSHGAGCNALIGAITQQPVLMDVGVASLTVAVRKPGKDKEAAPARPPHGHSVSEAAGTKSRHGHNHTHSLHHPGGVVPLREYYDMRLLASTDHLRSPPSTPSGSRSGSIASVLGAGGSRGRHANSLSSALGTLGIFDNGIAGQRSVSAGAYGPYSAVGRRPSGTVTRPSISLAFNNRSGSNGSIPSPLGRHRASSNTSVGLWSPVLTDDGNDDDMEILLSFAPENNETPKDDDDDDDGLLGPKPASMTTSSASSIHMGSSRPNGSATEAGGDKGTTAPQLGSGLGGLWGQPRAVDGNQGNENEDEHDSDLDEDEHIVRDLSSTKRRWTVTERA